MIWDRFRDIGVIQNSERGNDAILEGFLSTITAWRNEKKWSKADLVHLFNETLGSFAHKETFKYLDDRM